MSFEVSRFDFIQTIKSDLKAVEKTISLHTDIMYSSGDGGEAVLTSALKILESANDKIQLLEVDSI